MRARHVLSLVFITSVLISSCIGGGGGGGQGGAGNAGPDGGPGNIGNTGNHDAGSGGNLAACEPCSRPSQCATHFCNQIVGANDGRCSTPGDMGVCNCEQAVVNNGQVCTGANCPDGDPVLINCEQLSGAAVVVMATLPDGGVGGAGAGGAGGAAGAAGTGGVAGVGGSGGAPSGESIGGPCDSDTDCAQGLTCLEPDGTEWLGGGPSNGYCTLNCAADTTVCTPYGAQCVTALTPADSYCLEGCVRGGGLPKCHGREDSACYGVGGAVSACVPTCGVDEQCPTGYFCDLAGGVCMATAHPGDPIGTQCDPNNDACGGACGDFGGGLLMCTGYCTVGLDNPGCGIDPANGIPQGAPVCFPVFGDTDDNGDMGLCVQRCDCNSDCNHPAMVCVGFDDPVVEAAFGSMGICTIDDLVTPTLDCSLGTDAGVDGG